MLQCQHFFVPFWVSSQICDDSSQGEFFAQMMSCAVHYDHYDIIYHPLPINSPYLKMWGVTALCVYLNSPYHLELQHHNHFLLSSQQCS